MVTPVVIAVALLRVLAHIVSAIHLQREGREQGLSFFTLTFSNKNAPGEEGGLGSFQTSL